MKKGKIYNIAVTNRCNLKCRYCYNNLKDNIDMPRSIALKTINFITNDIKHNNICDAQIHFNSNEPLMNFDMIKFICHNFNEKKIKNITFTILSNLYCCNEEIFNWIKKNNIYIHTSLDGPQDMHDFNRGYGSWKKTVYWIWRMKRENINLIASCVVTKPFLKDYKRIINTYIKLGFKGISLRKMNKLVFAAKDKNLHIDLQDYIHFYNNALSYILHINKSKLFIDYGSLYIFNRIKGKNNLNYFISPPCSAITKQILIDPVGDIYPCDECRNYSQFKMGDVDKGIETSNVHKFNLQLKRHNGKSNIKELSSYCLALDLHDNQEKCKALKYQISHINKLIEQRNINNIFDKWNQ